MISIKHCQVLIFFQQKKAVSAPVIDSSFARTKRVIYYESASGLFLNYFFPRRL